MTTNSSRPGILSGLVDGVTGAARNVVALFINRIELAAIELSEIGYLAVRLLVVGLTGLVALLFAVGFWSALVVVLAWESMGWKILLVMAIVFSLLAAGLVLYVLSSVKNGRFGLSLTMEELRKDRDALM